MSGPGGTNQFSVDIFDEIAQIISDRSTQTWRRSAACLGLDPDLFFQDNSYDIQTRTAALAVCETCPVQSECREYALSKPPKKVMGIWGNTTERKRATIKSGRRVFA